ncbi:hypothetical protein [Cupriavidus necator]|uniref:hypothetical protein n=1 Tax=Cupriavidus necator TaxID=106590 RepID=UPI00059EDB4A|nr:hypothetical protein [Cupriavidus necator]
MLEIVRASQEVGYAVHDSRLIEGVSGDGIVVHDSHGAPLGAIIITALEDHLPVSRQIEFLALLRKESRIIQNLVHQSNFDVTQYAHLLAEGELYSTRALEVESPYPTVERPSGFGMATRYHQCVLLAQERIVRGWRTAAAVKDLIDTAAIPAILTAEFASGANGRAARSAAAYARAWVAAWLAADAAAPSARWRPHQNTLP